MEINVTKFAKCISTKKDENNSNRKLRSLYCFPDLVVACDGIIAKIELLDTGITKRFEITEKTQFVNTQTEIGFDHTNMPYKLFKPSFNLPDGELEIKNPKELLKLLKDSKYFSSVKFDLVTKEITLVHWDYSGGTEDSYKSIAKFDISKANDSKYFTIDRKRLIQILSDIKPTIIKFGNTTSPVWFSASNEWKSYYILMPLRNEY